MNLTPKQLSIMRMIRDSRLNHGFSPTMQEIADELGISKVTVFEHVGALERKGLLVRGRKHTARSLQVSPEFRFPDERPTRLPLAGRIAAGVLHEAVEQRERVDFSEMFNARNKNLFVLQVQGDSMIDDLISDGDFVVVHKQRTARKGQIVVAMTDEGEATLKRWFPEKNRIRLEPANSNMKPIYVKNARLLGVVVGVVRRV